MRCGAGVDRKAWKAKDSVVYFFDYHCYRITTTQVSRTSFLSFCFEECLQCFFDSLDRQAQTRSLMSLLLFAAHVLEDLHTSGGGTFSYESMIFCFVDTFRTQVGSSRFIFHYPFLILCGL